MTKNDGKQSESPQTKRTHQPEPNLAGPDFANATFDGSLVSQPISSLKPAQIMRLQRLIGNKAVSRSLNTSDVQRDIDPDPATSESFFNEGLAQYDQGDYRAAARSFEHASMFNPPANSPLLNLARIHMLLGHFASARIYLATLRRRNLGVDERAALADLSTDIEQAEQAERAAGNSPGEGNVAGRRWFELGLTRSDEEQWSDALEAFEQAIAADQPRFATLINMAICHLRLRNLASAVIMANRAAELPNADMAAVDYVCNQADQDHPLHIAN